MATSQAFHFKTHDGQEDGWRDRNSDYPNRRTLTDTTSGNTQTVTVTREEGTVHSPGDAFNANNMNDLEVRIDNAFKTHETNFQAGVETIKRAIQNSGGTVPSPATPANCATAISNLATAQYGAGRTQGQADPQYDSLYIVAEAYINYSGNIELKLTIKNQSSGGRELYSKTVAGTPGSAAIAETKTATHSYSGRISSIS